MLADWPTLKALDIHTESPAHLPPEALQAAKEIAWIPTLDKKDSSIGDFGIGEKIF